MDSESWYKHSYHIRLPISSLPNKNLKIKWSSVVSTVSAQEFYVDDGGTWYLKTNTGIILERLH